MFEDQGEQSVKNIDRPVRVWSWGNGASAPIANDAAVTELSTDLPSIAVMPFDNMSGDPEQGYFADGMTEDIITDLSKISGLLVIARNSSFDRCALPVAPWHIAPPCGRKESGHAIRWALCASLCLLSSSFFAAATGLIFQRP